MTVNADNSLACFKLRHSSVKMPDQFTKLPRYSPPNCIRNINGSSPCINNCSTNLREKIRFSPRSIFRRKLNICCKLTSSFDPLYSKFNYLALRLTKLKLTMQFRGSKKNMYTPLTTSWSDRLASSFNIPRNTTC